MLNPPPSAGRGTTGSHGTNSVPWVPALSNQEPTARRACRGYLLTAILLLSSGQAWPQAPVGVVTDEISYNVGDKVSLNIVFPSSGKVLPASDFLVTLRYAGDNRPVLDQVPLSLSTVASGPENSTGYHPFWQVPSDVRMGRYEIDLAVRDSKSGQVVLNLPRAASFAVHRKLLQIARVDLDKSFYVSGDPVGCAVTLRNLADRALSGLRVEFSERYWPWIAQAADRPGMAVVTLAEGLGLPPRGEQKLASPRAAVAKAVQQPVVQQYAAVVWDHDRKHIYDIAFSPLIFIRPPGGDAPKAYPLQYVYSTLDAVDVSSYRGFRPPEFSSAAIQFDSSHTMFASGSAATVKLSILNPTDQPWREVTVRARLQSPGGVELAKNVVAEKVDVAPHASPLKEETKFLLPADGQGVFRAVVEVSDSKGQILASNALEMGVDPLPKSVLIFCAHEDDEMAHAGIIRAAVENRIPLHVVYFTSGDAGSCDRYYEHSCHAAEALNFGALRMEEARRALGHLGVPREDIYFFGLPDGGSGQIWFHHLEPSNPYLAVLLASDHAPYEGLARPNLPYARQEVVEAAKEMIRKFQPQVIITAHPPAEGHIDHIVTNYFVVKALQDLSRAGALPPGLELRVDRIYDSKAHPSTPYQYEEHSFAISGEAAARAQEAGWYYQSQGGNRSQGNVRSFNQLPRAQVYRVVVDWKAHEGWNEKE